mgnify:CR=1 FL=1
MKLLLVITVACLITGDTDAQSWPGLTGIPDTSYNTNAAYRNSKKSNPETEYVQEYHPSTITGKKDIVYCTMGERKLVVDAFYPKKKANAKHIAIIIIHGGGWRSGNRAQHYPLAQHLADRGYACFTPEYRLSTEALYPAAVYDVKAAIRWVKENAKKYSIDTNKIALLGFSAGGQLAALTGNTNGNALFEGPGCRSESSSNVQAIVDIDGTLSFVHPESGEGDDSKRVSAATNWFGATKKDNPSLWEQASPLTWAGKNSVPTLFINSSVDRMHAGRNDYLKILYRNNIYTEVQKFDNSPHHFCLFNPWFEPTIKYTDDFLKKIFNR